SALEKHCEAVAALFSPTIVKSRLLDDNEFISIDKVCNMPPPFNIIIFMGAIIRLHLHRLNRNFTRESERLPRGRRSRVMPALQGEAEPATSRAFLQAAGRDLQANPEPSRIGAHAHAGEAEVFARRGVIILLEEILDVAGQGDVFRADAHPDIDDAE